MGYIALQVQRTAAESTAAAQPVVFDNVIYSAGNIGYDTLSGTITFNEAGRYIIIWWVATLSATSTVGVIFSLTSSQLDDIQSDSTIKTGEVSGMGIIGVATAPVTLSLVNRCAGPVNYSSSVPVKASLMVFSDEPDTGLLGTSYCFAVSQLAYVVGQLIDYYPPETIYQVFTKSATTISGTIVQLYASPDAYGAGLLILADSSVNETYAISLSMITVVATPAGTAYDARIAYITPGSPLPKGCDTNIIASIQSYLTVLEFVPTILLGPFTSASGNVYKNEYGLLVLAELDGSSPIFIPTYNIIDITKVTPLALPLSISASGEARPVSVVIKKT